MKTKILAADILICDALVQRSQVPKIEQLIKEYADRYGPVKPGGKYELKTQEEFEAFKAAIGDKATYSAGGSLANTLTTVKKLQGDKVDITFIGAYGNDEYGQEIKKEIQESGIKLVPSYNNSPIDGVETPVSFVINDDRDSANKDPVRNGDSKDRIIFTYRGNVGEKVRDLVADFNPDISEEAEQLQALCRIIASDNIDKKRPELLEAINALLATHSETSITLENFSESLPNALDKKYPYASNKVDAFLEELRGQMKDAYPANLEPIQLEKLVSENNVVMVASSVGDDSKYGALLLKRLVEAGKAHRKDLWVTLPTSPKSSDEERRRISPYLKDANLVLGNMHELCNIAACDYHFEKKEALTELGELWGVRDDNIKDAYFSGAGGERPRPHVALITDSHQPTRIVGDMLSLGQTTREVKVPGRDEDEIKSTLGAGDAFAAGVIHALLLQRGQPKDQNSPQNIDRVDYYKCAEVGHALAQATMRVPGARLENSTAALNSTMLRLGVINSSTSMRA